MAPASAAYMLVPHMNLSPEIRQRVIMEEMAEGRQVWSDMTATVNGQETKRCLRAANGARSCWVARCIVLDQYPLQELKTSNFRRWTRPRPRVRAGRTDHRAAKNHGEIPRNEAGRRRAIASKSPFHGLPRFASPETIARASWTGVLFRAESSCRCGFWSSREELAEAPVSAKREAGWDFRCCKETLLGLHQVFWRQAEGNRTRHTASEFEFPCIGRPKIGSDSDNRGHIRVIPLCG